MRTFRCEQEARFVTTQHGFYLQLGLKEFKTNKIDIDNPNASATASKSDSNNKKKQKKFGR